MSLILYNTLTRKKEPFTPGDPARVTMYVCGLTVYNHPHIGNARSAVAFDVLHRLLRHTYGDKHVVFARNVTDVDDKINAAAKEQGVPISTVTERFTDAFRKEWQRLGIASPTIEPLATQHIPQIIAMIENLLAKGHAYAAEGHVLFDVPSFKDYGSLSGRNRDDMIAGARVEVAPYKRDPADFVLWKPSTPDLPGWDSPWGRGRPGWHIECSAMIETHLGETIDIHGGGHDLIFPHHENELAQSTCAHAHRPLARFWLHNGFLTMDKEKMSKSVGNIVSVHEPLEKWPGEVIRLALLSAHYRQPLDWSDDSLEQAKATLDRGYRALQQARHIKPTNNTPFAPVVAALADDINTPQAMAQIAGLVNALNSSPTDESRAETKGRLLASGELLGILQQDPEAWFNAAKTSSGVDAAEVERLIAARLNARKAKDFKEADRLRAAIAALGVTIEDRPDGTKWRVE